MALLSCPSEALPGPPRLSVDLPDDWSLLQPGLAVLRARAPERSSGQAPELRVDVWSEEPGTSVEELLTQIAQQFAPQAQSEPSFVVELAGRTWTGVNLGWVGPVGTEVEVQLASPLDEGRFARFVTVVGRVGGESADEDYDLLQSVMETVRVEEDA